MAVGGETCPHADECPGPPGEHDRRAWRRRRASHTDSPVTVIDVGRSTTLPDAPYRPPESCRRRRAEAAPRRAPELQPPPEERPRGGGEAPPPRVPASPRLPARPCAEPQLRIGKLTTQSTIGTTPGRPPSARSEKAKLELASGRVEEPALDSPGETGRALARASRSRRRMTTVKMRRRDASVKRHGPCQRTAVRGPGPARLGRRTERRPLDRAARSALHPLDSHAQVRLSRGPDAHPMDVS